MVEPEFQRMIEQEKTHQLSVDESDPYIPTDPEPISEPEYPDHPLPGEDMFQRPVDLEQVLDVPHVDRGDRSTAVDGAARALTVALGDAGGLNVLPLASVAAPTP